MYLLLNSLLPHSPVALLHALTAAAQGFLIVTDVLCPGGRKVPGINGNEKEVCGCVKQDGGLCEQASAGTFGRLQSVSG